MPPVLRPVLAVGAVLPSSCAGKDSAFLNFTMCQDGLVNYRRMGVQQFEHGNVVRSRRIFNHFDSPWTDQMAMKMVKEWTNIPRQLAQCGVLTNRSHNRLWGLFLADPECSFALRQMLVSTGGDIATPSPFRSEKNDSSPLFHNLTR